MGFDLQRFVGVRDGPNVRQIIRCGLGGLGEIALAG